MIHKFLGSFFLLLMVIHAAKEIDTGRAGNACTDKPHNRGDIAAVTVRGICIIQNNIFYVSLIKFVPKFLLILKFYFVRYADRQMRK